MRLSADDYEADKDVVASHLQDDVNAGLPVDKKIADLKTQRGAIKAQRKKCAQALRDEKRKRARFKEKAKSLSADLVAVLGSRPKAATEKAKQVDEAENAKKTPPLDLLW